jgi:hypothetical protein
MEKKSFTWEKSYWKKAHIVTTEQGRDYCTALEMTSPDVLMGYKMNL